MDKSPVSHIEQKQFFDSCMAAGRKCFESKTVECAYKIGSLEFTILMPAESEICEMLFFLKCHERESPCNGGVRIFLCSNHSPGFEVPKSVFDRFRFTLRGDILGFEGGEYPSAYLPREDVLLSVSKPDRTAVVFLRKLQKLQAADSAKILAIVLMLLSEDEDFCIIPSGLDFEGDKAVIRLRDKAFVTVFDPEISESKLLELPHQLTAVLLKDEVSAFHWFSEEDCNNSTVKASGIVKALKMKCSEEYGQEPSIEILKNSLILDLLSFLPYSLPSHFNFIERLFSRIAVVSADENTPLKKCSSDFNYPLLSIIIPAYNAESYIGDLLDSIAGLNYPKKEIILVDDGSSDETARIARNHYLSPDYYYQKRAGVSAARNRGYRESKGELLLFVDADDLIDKDVVLCALKWLGNNPNTDIMKTHAQKFITDNDARVLFISSPQESFPYYIGSALIRRNAFERVGEFDEELQLSEDTDWFVRAAEKNCVILQMHGVGLYVRRHTASLTAQHGLNEKNLLKLLKKKIERNS